MGGFLFTYIRNLLLLRLSETWILRIQLNCAPHCGETLVNKMNKKNLYRILLTLLTCLMLVIPVISETRNQVLSGDEIVTYSMANNTDGGFVFSEGRVAGFLKDNVIDKDFGKTVSNLFAQGMDVLKNRSRSAFFTYEPDPEVRFYTHDEMADWVEKRNYELFNLPVTWLNSTSDESNSYLYYSLMNIVSSLIPPISGTKWSGFILNYLIFILLLYAFWNLTDHFELDRKERLWITILFGTACDVITHVCLIRAYLFAMTLTAISAGFHLRMWKQAEDGSTVSLRWVVPVTVLTVFSHYSTILCIFSFAFVSLICFLKHSRKKEAGRYILLTVLGGVIAAVLDPFSVAGLLIKFVSDSNGTASGFLAELKEYCFVSLFPLAALIPLLACTLYNRIVRKKKLTLSRCAYLGATVLICTVLIALGMKSRRYLSILTPLYLLLLGLLAVWNYRCFASERSSLPAYAAAVFTVAVIGMSLFNSLHSFDQANAKQTAIRQAIAPYTQETCVLMRGRRTAYEYVPEISQFDGCQVITLSSKNWQDLVSGEAFKDEMVLITVGIKNEDIPQDWLTEQHFSVQEPFFESSGITARLMRKS